jgi:phosphatidyl-myo-inositol alpha-mannosyltransferase
MKIGFVLDDSLDKADGVQQYVLALGEWLSDQGHEVHYLVGETHRKDLRRVHSLSRNLTVTFNGNRLSTPLPANKRHIKNILDKEKFDILHVQMPYSPFMAARVIRLAPQSCAVIGTFHILPYGRRERWATYSLRLLLARTLLRFDTVLSVSKPAQRFAKQSLGLRSTILPNVVDVKRFNAARPLTQFNDGKINIIFLGRLVPRKGCYELLEAVQDLHDHGQLQNTRVIIAGQGGLRGQLENFVSVNRLKHIVHFTGFLKESEKARYLASADIAVFPSLSGESFGIVLIEAMAAGARVVLGGDNPGYRSVLGDQPSQLVTPQSKASFSRSLKHFIRNSRARQRATRWQSQQLDQYDVATVGRRLVQIYSKALQSRVRMR